jgi:hypothetical protein
VDVLDGYEWITVPAGHAAPEIGEVITHAANDPFTAIAARRAILDAMYRQRGQITQVETLDRLHAIAVEQGIVTPYSSMIVLVNDRQELLLKELEMAEDRFQREQENVGTTTTASPFTVTGVPEPHEWLLIGLAAAILGWYLLKGRRLMAAR